MITVTYDEYECNIRVVDEDDTQHVLQLYKLYEKVEPQKCSMRFSAGKRFTVTLQKWLETSWKELTRVPTK